MTMIAKITEPVTAVALDGAFATVPRRLAPSASPRRPVAPSVTPNSRSLVIVVPDPIDAIVEVGSEAGLEGGSKLLWTLGVLLLLAV
ncbi:MAG: hypothetical protein ABSA66_15535 [Roseiarcus sp.]|jgi:hypothetical protein